MTRSLGTIGDVVLRKYNLKLRSACPVTVPEYTAKVLMGMADGYAPEDMERAIYLESILERPPLP